MPKKSQFKMLDKTNTQFPTIREARLREQWRFNSQRYYAKKKLEKALNPNSNTTNFEKHFQRVYTNPTEIENLKIELATAIRWFYDQNDMVTEEEKQINEQNIKLLDSIFKLQNKVSS
jgi:hypothetical protein